MGSLLLARKARSVFFDILLGGLDCIVRVVWWNFARAFGLVQGGALDTLPEGHPDLVEVCLVHCLGFDRHDRALALAKVVRLSRLAFSS